MNINEGSFFETIGEDCQFYAFFSKKSKNFFSYFVGVHFMVIISFYRTKKVLLYLHLCLSDKHTLQRYNFNYA